MDVVEARKSSWGKENIFYKGFSKLFYGLLKAVGKIDLENCSDFKLMGRPVVDSLNAMPERQTFFRALSSWVGYKTTVVYFRCRLGMPVPQMVGGTVIPLRNPLYFRFFHSADAGGDHLWLLYFFVFAVVLGLQTLISTSCWDIRRRDFLPSSCYCSSSAASLCLAWGLSATISPASMMRSSSAQDISSVRPRMIRRDLQKTFNHPIILKNVRRSYPCTIVE